MALLMRVRTTILVQCREQGIHGARDPVEPIFAVKAGSPATIQDICFDRVWSAESVDLEFVVAIHWQGQ